MFCYFFSFDSDVQAFPQAPFESKMQELIKTEYQPTVMNNGDQLEDKFGNINSSPNLNMISTENIRVTQNDGNYQKQVSQLGRDGNIFWDRKLIHNGKKSRKLAVFSFVFF